MHKHYGKMTRLVTIGLALQNELDEDELTESNLCQLWNIGLNLELLKVKHIQASVFTPRDLALLFEVEEEHIEVLQRKNLAMEEMLQHLGDENAIGIINEEYTFIVADLYRDVTAEDETCTWLMHCIRHQIAMHKSICKRAIYQAVRDYGVEMVTGLLRVNTAYVRRMYDSYAEEHQLEKLST